MLREASLGARVPLGAVLQAIDPAGRKNRENMVTGDPGAAPFTS